MAAKVLVSIVAATVVPDPPAWHLEYEVRNAGSTPVWLVDGESLSIRVDGSRIELSSARDEMQADVHVFAYFDPAVIALPAGGRLRRTVRIDWPYALSGIWNAGQEAAPPPGDYQVAIRVGYGTTAAPDPPVNGDSVEAPVLRWQQTVVSAPVQIAVPPYRRTR